MPPLVYKLKTPLAVGRIQKKKKKKITVLPKVVILQPCLDRHLLKATCSALFCFVFSQEALRRAA